MTRSPKSKRFRRCVRAIIKGCPAYGTTARLYCGKAGRAGKETRAQATYCMRKGRKDWATSKGLHGGFEMATRRKRRRSRYGDGAPASSGMTAAKKKKLIILGIGAVGIAGIALFAGSASASTPTLGKPAGAISAGKSWIDMPPVSGAYPKGYYADPKTGKLLATTFPAPAGQTVTSAQIQAAFDRNITAYKAGVPGAVGSTWIDVQDVGDWSQASKLEKMKAAGF